MTAACVTGDSTGGGDSAIGGSTAQPRCVDAGSAVRLSGGGAPWVQVAWSCLSCTVGGHRPLGQLWAPSEEAAEGDVAGDGEEERRHASAKTMDAFFSALQQASSTGQDIKRMLEDTFPLLAGLLRYGEWCADHIQ